MSIKLNGLNLGREVAAAQSARDDAQTAQTAAETAQAGAETARDDAVAIVIADADAAMATAIETPGTQTATALSASLDARTSRASRVADGIFSAFDRALEQGRSASIQLQGDSTGNATDEWVYLMTQWLAQRHPTAHVKYTSWRDGADQEYDNWTTLQSGTAGERHALFKGLNLTRTMYLPNSNIPAITGDFELVVRVALDDWTPGATQTIAAHYGAAGARSWRLAVGPTGLLDFIWSPDGTTNIQRFSTAPLGITDGAWTWLKITLTVNNGAGGYTWKAYKGTSLYAFTEIGSDYTTTGGPTSIFDANQDWEIGGRGLTGEPMAGKIYEVHIRQGLNQNGGKIINPQPIESWIPRDASGTYEAGSFGGGPTIYVLNGSHPGAGYSYFTDPTRHPRMVRPYAGALNFQSSSYNDVFVLGATLVTERDAWLALTDARAPGCQTVIVTQFPIRPEGGTNRALLHERRRQQIMAWAARKGLVVIDTYQKALDYPGGFTSLIDPADGVHPTPKTTGDGTSGQEVWLAAVTEAWDAASPQ